MFGILPDKLKEEMTPTDFYKWVGVLEEEPNDRRPEYHYWAQISWYLDVILHVLSNLFNPNPPKFERTVEDHVINFTTVKPKAADAPAEFRPPVIRGGKVIDPGSAGVVPKALPAREEDRPRRHLHLSDEQREEAERALNTAKSKAVWRAFAGRCNEGTDKLPGGGRRK